MTKYVVAMQFENDDATYRVYSDLGNSEVGLAVVSSALVAKDDQGHISVREASDGRAGSGYVGGSLIGMLVGILGGPLGVLLGWGVGATVGALRDSDRANDEMTAVDVLSRSLQPGRNAILLETDETDTAVLDSFAERNGGTLVRQPLEEVEEEIKAEQQAVAAAQKAAREQLKDQRRADRKAEREAKHAE